MVSTFKNKTVLVTGATRGIGKQIAHDFDACGAHLILTGTDKNQVIKLNCDRKLNARYLCVDFTDKGSFDRFLKEISPMKIDICINNAGINYIDGMLDYPQNKWEELMHVNLDAPFRISQVVARNMKKHLYGRIINIASIYGVISREKRIAYSASKSGLIGLSRAMAIDLAQYGILVNSVSAGFVKTDLTKSILSEGDIRRLEQEIPLKRFATTKDISNTVLFLASEMSSYITGQNIVVDGGYVAI